MSFVNRLTIFAEAVVIKISVYLIVLFIFMLILVLLDEITDIFVDISVYEIFIEALYWFGTGIMLVINFFVMLFRENGIDIWLTELFNFLVKSFGFLGHSIFGLIEGFLLGIVNIFGELLALINNGSKVVCLGSCNPIPDLNNPPDANVADIWVFVDLGKGEIGFGARARFYNEIIVPVAGTIFTQSDHIYFQGAFNLPKFGIWVDAFFFVQLDRQEWFLVGALADFGKQIYELFPTWEELFDEFFKFGTILR